MRVELRGEEGSAPEVAGPEGNDCDSPPPSAAAQAKGEAHADVAFALNNLAESYHVLTR